jgi:hypothetical protein
LVAAEDKTLTAGNQGTIVVWQNHGESLGGEIGQLNHHSIEFEQASVTGCLTVAILDAIGKQRSPLHLPYQKC